MANNAHTVPNYEGNSNNNKNNTENSQERLQFQEAFELFDKDHDGVITVSEILSVLNKFGKSPAVDEDKSKLEQKNLLSFEQFMQLMTSKASMKDIDDELMEAFKVFDKDGNGVISVAEMKEALKNIGENLTDVEINSILMQLDSNGDGEISYEGNIKKRTDSVRIKEIKK